MYSFALYCPKHYKEIENYDLALADDFVGWVCHHRNGEEFSIEWLKANNMYYNRNDPHEFKFVRREEHRRIHRRPCATKGKHWYTDGKNNVLAYSCPAGYRKGVTQYNGHNIWL